METIFERMGSLATLLDDELQTIETRFRVLSTSSQSHFDGPAKKVVECQREIESLKKDIDGLIHVADEQYKHFDGFLKGIIDTLAEFDEKIVQVEQHAANYGYVAPTRDNVDLPRILSDIEVFIQIHNFPCIRYYNTLFEKSVQDNLSGSGDVKVEEHGKNLKELFIKKYSSN